MFDANLQAFEAWCKKEHPECTDFTFEKFNYQFYCYNDTTVSNFFTGWQARGVQYQEQG